MYVVKTYTVLDMGNFPTILNIFLVPYQSDVLLPPPSTVDGYTFVELIGNPDDVTENRDIFYVYGINSYTITYLQGEGIETYSPETVEYNETLTLPTPTREGYTFAGWFKGDSINDAQFTNSTNVEESLSLVARWQVNHTITFYSGYTYINVDPIVGIYGSEVEMPDNPEEPVGGETFGGWYADSACTIPYVFDTMPAADIMVFIKWIDMSEFLSNNIRLKANS